MRKHLVVALLVVVAAVGVTGALLAPRTLESDVRSGSAAESAPRQGTRGAAPRARAAAGEASGDEAVAPSPDARTIRGIVREVSGAPIAGALVSVHGPDPDRPVVAGVTAHDLVRHLAQARTAENGRFELTAAAENWSVVLARKEGYATSSLLILDTEITADCDLILTAAQPTELLVVDERDEPVAGARVLRFEGSRDLGRLVETAETDRDGRARIVVLKGPGDSILVRAARFEDASLGEELDDRSDAPIRIVLKDGRSVAGVVVDDAGRQMAGVRVTLGSDTVTTAADGAFRFDGLGPTLVAADGLWLKAEREGWCGGEHVDVWPGDLGVRVVLRRSATVRGVVVHEDGSPAPHALVRNDVVSDQAGRFELAGFRSGHQIVWADAWSKTDPPVPVHGSEWADAPPGGTVEDLKIILAPGAWNSYVQVRVVDPEGRPAAKVDLVAWDGVTQVGRGQTGDDGTQLLRLRDRGGARVRIAAGIPGPPHVDAVAEQAVEARTVPPFESVALRLGPPGTLRLRGIDPEGREVKIEPAHVDAGVRAVANADGTFQLPATERFWGVLRVPGFADRSVVFEPPHDRARVETLHFVPAVAVAGRVLSADGRPARGVSIRAVVCESGTGDWEDEDAEPSDDGRFKLTTLPAGRVFLRVLDASDDDRVLLLRTFDLTADTPMDLGELRLAGPLPLHGVVVDEKGRGIGGAAVVFTDAGEWTACPPVCTRPDGTFDVSLPGRYPLRLRVTRRGRATQFVPANSGAPEPVRIVLGPPGRVCVHEEFDAGPAGRQRPSVRPPGTDWEWTPPDVDDARDTGDGGDVYGDLPPGPLEVVLRTGGTERVQRVEVVAGKTVECVFEK